MSKPQDRTIYKTDNGWANKRNDASRPSSLHDTQKDAYDAARENLINQGGGEISIKGLDGRIRDKNTISPGNDPRSIRG